MDQGLSLEQVHYALLYVQASSLPGLPGEMTVEEKQVTSGWAGAEGTEDQVLQGSPGVQCVAGRPGL